MLTAACHATAQVTLAGNLSFSQTGYSRSEGFDATLPQGMAFTFAPQVGIQLGERVMTGIRLGISNSIYTYTDGFYDRDQGKWNISSEEDRTLMKAIGALFMRMRCIEWGDLSLHLEFSGGYAYGMGASTKKEYRTDGTTFKINRKYNLGQIEVKVVPVVSLALSPHAGIDLYADLLSLAYSRTTATYRLPVNLTETSVDAGVDYTLTTSGFDAGLHTLTATLLSLGFHYRF